MNLPSSLARVLPSPRRYGSASRFEALADAIDETVRTLRWCRNHLEERQASEALRLAQIDLGIVALAIDWEMEGERENAKRALERLWREPSDELARLHLHRPESGC